MGLWDVEPPSNDAIRQAFKENGGSDGRVYLEYDGKLVALAVNQRGTITYALLSRIFGPSRRLRRETIKVNNKEYDPQALHPPAADTVDMLTPEDNERGRYRTPDDPIKITGIPVDIANEGPTRPSSWLQTDVTKHMNRYLQWACKHGPLEKILPNFCSGIQKRWSEDNRQHNHQPPQRCVRQGSRRKVLSKPRGHAHSCMTNSGVHICMSQPYCCFSCSKCRFFDSIPESCICGNEWHGHTHASSCVYF